MDKKICVTLIAHNQCKCVMMQLQNLLKMDFADRDVSVVIVDNASTDELAEWLGEQKYFDYIVCDEKIENYAEILNTVHMEFAADRDLFVVSPELLLTQESIENMYAALHGEKDAGAVFIEAVSEEAAERNKCQASNDKYDTALSLTMKETVFAVRRDCMAEVGAYNVQLQNPENILMDYSFRCILNGYKIYALQDTGWERLEDHMDSYNVLDGFYADRVVLKKEWGMNYFNTTPNMDIVSLISRQEKEAFQVLEIGCDLGATMLQVKKKYKNADVYGVELNERAAEIAGKLFQVEIADIEECKVLFQDIKFDYIVFGDVLEHLRNPAEVIKFCKESLLKKDGRIIASIPNLMHFSVMKNLLVHGNFTYTDTGLLDRTHIHMFTWNEIVKMFSAHGFQIEQALSTRILPAEEDVEFVEKLLELSGDGVNEVMYYTYQYIISAVSTG